MASYGFNFRASSGYVTDPAGTTYAFANNFATDTYPDAAISSALGVNAGWYATAGMESFDISTGADARLAGLQRLNADNQVNGFRVDIAAGDADIRLAVGSQAYASPNALAEAFDNATSRGVLVDQAGGVTGNNFRDATDTLRSLAAWPGSNAAARVNIASGICIVKFGRGSGGSNRMHVAHMAVEEVASSGSTGTLAETNANDTSAASGSTTILGTVARTNAADTSAAAGTTTVTGSLTSTNGADTLAASGTAGSVSGTLAAANANDSAAAAGTTTILGALAATNAGDTLAAAGTTTVAGALGFTNANDTLSASGTAGAPSGTVAVTNANDTLSTSGTPIITGSAAVTNRNDALSAQGQAGIDQGGGGGPKRKRKPFKSWDQRQREREAEIKAQQEAIAARLARENRDKYGDLPPALEKELAGAPAAQAANPLDPQALREYEARMRPALQNDDEEAFALILGLL